jgi:hypothetical protein
MIENPRTEDPERPEPIVVAVTYKPESLADWEEWRMALYRMYPGSRRAVLKAVVIVLYFVLALAFLGYLIGLAGSPGLQPEFMAIAFAAAGLFYPIRLRRIKTMLTTALREHSPYSIELFQEGLTIRIKNRVTWIEWPEVRDVLVTRIEFVFLYRAGDTSWVPRKAFLDPEHADRFLEVARWGLSHSRATSTSQPALDGRR